MPSSSDWTDCATSDSCLAGGTQATFAAVRLESIKACGRGAMVVTLRSLPYEHWRMAYEEVHSRGGIVQSGLGPRRPPNFPHLWPGQNPSPDAVNRRRSASS